MRYRAWHTMVAAVAVVSLGLAVGAAASGVTAAESSGLTGANALEQRAQAFWSARVTGDWLTVYRFLTEAQRAGVSAGKFAELRRTKGPLAYRAAAIGEVAAADDVGWVDVSYTAAAVLFPQMPSRDMRIWEIWEKRDGQWYPVPRGRRAELPHLPPRFRSTPKAAELAERADGFWDAKQREDWVRIYDYLEPAYQARISREEFLKRKALYIYLAHSFEWVEVSDGRGRVKVRYTRRLDGSGAEGTEAEESTTIEQWVHVDGNWYLRIEA